MIKVDADKIKDFISLYPDKLLLDFKNESRN